MSKRLIVVLVVIPWIAGCDIDFSFLFGRGPEANVVELRKFASERELRDYIVEQSNNSFRGGPFEDTIAVAESDGAAAPGNAPSPGSAGGDADGGTGTNLQGDDGNSVPFSSTTEQEEGVQEADVVKNDGQYIYVLSRGNLRIVQANPPESAQQMASVELDGFGRDLYLLDNRVVALTTPEFSAIPVDTPVVVGDGPEPEPGSDGAAPIADDGKTVGLDIAIAPPRFFIPQVEVTVIDVTDRSNPQVLSRTTLDGSLTTSRMIGDRLHLVIVNHPTNFVESVSDAELGELLPDVVVEMSGTQEERKDISDVDGFFRPADPDGLGFTSVVSMDIDDPAGFSAQTVVGFPANVYSSTEALYLTNSQFRFDGTARESTDIYKFAYTDDGTSLAAAGSVPGRVLNQYSMGEHDGFLRLATTVRTGGGFEPGTTRNDVYVLEQVGDSLEMAGSVEGLAPGESIFSARFIGDRGYLVTFEQIDPLFTLDMSDPRDPQAVGELKVPGFSTFILPLNDNYLLTVGRHTDENQQFIFPEGVRLSIFDVSDFANPQLAHFEVIGTNGGSSEALHNPKALTYFGQRDLLALPVELYNFGPVLVGGPEESVNVDGGGSPDSTDGDTDMLDAPPPDDPVTSGTNGMEPMPEPVPEPQPAPPPVDVGISFDEGFFSGLYVYRATPEGGFEFLGRLSALRNDRAYFGPEFTRGIFIGDTVCAVTSDNVQVSMVEDVEEPVATVDFPVPDSAGPPILIDPVVDVAGDGDLRMGDGATSTPASDDAS